MVGWDKYVSNKALAVTEHMDWFKTADFWTGNPGGGGTTNPAFINDSMLRHLQEHLVHSAK